MIVLGLNSQEKLFMVDSRIGCALKAEGRDNELCQQSEAHTGYNLAPVVVIINVMHLAFHEFHMGYF